MNTAIRHPQDGLGGAEDPGRLARVARLLHLAVAALGMFAPAARQGLAVH